MVAPDGTLQASAPIQSQALASPAPAPHLLGSAAVGSGAKPAGVNAALTRAYVLNNSSIQAYNISGKGAPVVLGSAAAFGNVAVNAAGARAYLGVFGRSNGRVQAFDVSGGPTPVLLGNPTSTGSTAPLGIALNAVGT